MKKNKTYIFVKTNPMFDWSEGESVLFTDERREKGTITVKTKFGNVVEIGWGDLILGGYIEEEKDDKALSEEEVEKQLTKLIKTRIRTYNGHFIWDKYDAIWLIDELIDKFNGKGNYQIGKHSDEYVLIQQSPFFDWGLKQVNSELGQIMINNKEVLKFLDLIFDKNV